MTKVTTRREINEDRLLWLDLETTGLNPQSDAILEVALVVTDFDLRCLDQIDFVITQSKEELAKMNDWCREQHTASGLLASIEDGLSLDVAEQALVDFIVRNGAKDAALCGNTIRFDRGFLEIQMPRLASLLHYRSIDTSTLVLMSYVCDIALPEKKDAHRARADIFESIEVARKFRSEMKKAVA